MEWYHLGRSLRERVMARSVEKIFSECLERMERGESIEECLRSYPEHAFELEPLLRTALGVRSTASRYEPRPYFKTLARARLDGAQRYARYARQPEAYPIWQRAWVPALAAVTAVLFIGVGTVAASSHALPKEALYPVKMAAEKVRVAFTFSDVEKAIIHVELAEERSDEIAAMAARGNTDQIMKTTDRLVAHLEQANTAIVKVTEDISLFSTADVDATPSEPAFQPPSAPVPSKEQPVVEPEPEPVPEPEQAEVEPEPEPAPEPEQAAVEPEPEPAPETEQVAVEPEPEPSEAGPEQVTTDNATAPMGEQDRTTGTGQEQPAGEQTIQTASELAKILEFEQLKKTLDVSLAKNVVVLENALDETPDELKPALQHAIDLSNKLKTETRSGPAFNVNDNPTQNTLKKKKNNSIRNIEKNTEQNTEQDTEQNTEQNAEQNTEKNTEQNSEQNMEQDSGQNSEQDTEQNGKQNTGENTGQNKTDNTKEKQNQTENQSTGNK
jgi:hypothetical protein